MIEKREATFLNAQPTNGRAEPGFLSGRKNQGSFESPDDAEYMDI